MTKSILLLGGVLFFAAVSPALVSAQFQQPDPNELKMTSDPKAPGAAAVYLDIKEIDNDPCTTRSFYARIKVLTEKGKELATVEMPYLQGKFKITDIKGRTIHPDGTVVPLTGKPEDLLIAKAGPRSTARYLPAQRRGRQHPGIPLRSGIRRQSALFLADWEIQKPYFVHKAHYVHTFDSSCPHRHMTGRPTLVDIKGDDRPSGGPTCRRA